MSKVKSMILRIIKINNKTTIDEKDRRNFDIIGEILGERIKRSSSSLSFFVSLLFTIFLLFGISS